MLSAEFDRFTLLPENIERNFQLIEGEMVEKLPNVYVSILGTRIVGLLGIYLLSNPIGELTGPTCGYKIGHERYMPNVAYMSHKRFSKLRKEDIYVPFAPDLAVEVFSPSNTEKQMRIKVANYLAAETVVWVVDADARTVEVYTPAHSAQTLTNADTLTAGNVLPGFEVKVSEIWPITLTTA